MLEQHLNAVMKACTECEAGGRRLFRSRANPALKKAVKAARKEMRSRRTTSKRVIQFAARAIPRSSSPTYDTDWDSDAYLTVSGQNSNNSVRVTDDFLEAVERRRPIVEL